MSYLDRVVKPGETLLVRARLHWVIYLRSFVVMAIAVAWAVGVAIWSRTGAPSPSLVLGLYLLAALLMAFAVVRLAGQMLLRSTTEFGVTNHRIIVKRGLVSLHTVEMSVDKVESVDVDQTVLGRLLGYGTVTVHGIGARWDPIPQIADPLAFRNAITTH